jgi:multiple sugar transport system substrate-binding protein
MNIRSVNLIVQLIHPVIDLFCTQIRTVLSRRSPAWNERWRRFGCYVMLGVLLSGLVMSCGQEQDTSLISSIEPSPETSSITDTTLTIWWDKGFVLEEDEALQQLVNQWQQETGHTVNLSLYTTDDLPQKAQRALQANNPPDILMSHSAERVLNPQLAWEGKLADVSDIIEPIQDQYSPTVLDSVRLYNQTTKQRRYYAIPIHQATTQIFYRRDLLEQAGRKAEEIPQDWNGFWEFWKQVQDSLAAQRSIDAQPQIYGLGLPFSDAAGDTYEVVEQMLEAYNVKILDTDGHLLVNDPTIRQNIIDCLTWYSQFYQQKYVPPDAINWTNADNNRQLLNRQIVMTPNNSLSIPAAVRSDPEVYYKQLGTIGYPNKPNGDPMRYLTIVRQAVIFNNSKHQALAKEFLAYLMQPDVAATYTKAGLRNLPVNQQVWQDPYWTDPADPHTSTVAKTFTQAATRLFYYAQHPAYSLVLEENVWGRAVHRIVTENISPEQAADEAIDRIQTIFEQWQ